MEEERGSSRMILYKINECYKSEIALSLRVRRIYEILCKTKSTFNLKYLSTKIFNNDNKYLTSFDIIYSLIIFKIDLISTK